MITIKEEFLTDAKTLRAIKLGGYEVLALWLAMKVHAATHLTDGFVSEFDIESLPGAPKRVRKALAALVDCGRQNRDGSRGAGLVDKVDGGWQLHDYLDHAKSRDEVELQREKARKRKQAERERARVELERIRSELDDVSLRLSRGASRRDSARDSGGESHRPSQPVSLAGARAVPSPAQPSPAQGSPHSPPEGGECESGVHASVVLAEAPRKPPRHVRNFEASFGVAHPADMDAFDRWSLRFGKSGALFDARRASCLEDRRLEGMTPDDVDAALEGAAVDQWAATTGFKLSVIFGDRERFEAYRDTGRQIRSGTYRPPVKPGAPQPIQPNSGYVPKGKLITRGAP